MKLDPEIRVGRLLLAIPSFEDVLRKYGVHVSGSEERTLREVCNERGVALEEVLKAIDELNWSEEARTPGGDIS